VQQITETTGSRGSSFKVPYVNALGNKTTKRFRTLKEAEQFRTLYEASKLGVAAPVATGLRRTFASMAAEWAATADHTDATRDAVARDLRLHILPTLGSHQLRAVTTRQLAAWLRALEGRLSPSSVNRCLGWVKGILRAAVEDHQGITVNPADSLRVDKGDPAPRMALTGDQVEAIIAALPEHYRMCARLAADTGMRLSEVLGLRSSAVDWLSASPVVHVDRQLITPPASERAPYLRHTKHGKTGGRREVPLSPATVAALAAHMAAHPQRGSCQEETGAKVIQVDDLVFTSDAGKPVNRHLIGRAWRLAAKRAGVPGAHFHDLRHYYATLMIEAGLSDRTIGMLLGHSTAAVTALYGTAKKATERAADVVALAIAARQVA
jgi:integrase